MRVSAAWRVLGQFEDSLQRSPFKLSFSQSGEDLIVWFLLGQLGIQRPTYLDIGAHHPEHLSNTALFHFLGCRGINIEPDPRLFPAFVARRPGDLNLNIGIGATQGSMTLYRMTDPSLSTFSRELAERLVNEHGIAIDSCVQVPVQTIRSVLALTAIRPDFVTIDAEGTDVAVLESYDFSSHRPAVFCVETISFSLRGDGAKNVAVGKLMATRGYRTYADTYINTIFVDALRFGSSERSEHLHHERR